MKHDIRCNMLPTGDRGYVVIEITTPHSNIHVVPLGDQLSLDTSFYGSSQEVVEFLESIEIRATTALMKFRDMMAQAAIDGNGDAHKLGPVDLVPEED